MNGSRTVRVLGVLPIVFLALEVSANTIADAYVGAVLDPYGFEQSLTNEVAYSSDYYQRFATCSDLAINGLQEAVEQIHEQLIVATGQEYVVLQRQLTEMQEFLREMRWLDEVVARHEAGERGYYLQTEMAQAAILLTQVAQSQGISVKDLRRPRVMSLMAIPCT